MTSIYFEYRHLRDVPDEHGWIPLALVRQLIRPRKIKMLLNGAEGDCERKVVGKRPTELRTSSRLSGPRRDVKPKRSEDKLEIYTFKQDLLFGPGYGKSID